MILRIYRHQRTEDTVHKYYSQLIFHKNVKQTQWRKEVFSAKGDGAPEQPNGKKERLIISHHIQKLTTGQLTNNKSCRAVEK